MNGQTIIVAVVATVTGIAATTLTVDVLGKIARRSDLVAGAKRIWVGRWYIGILQGRFVHSNIAETPDQPGDKRAPWVPQGE